uniref:NADH-ubiquinone oxidoreductase chain 1 n=2 Tax=Haliotis diversicolor TaxID=36095 RepID=A0A8K1HQ62_HALDV|nr:NADH dehydrogenase subunit 1 [Haliotis diversicolor supertexta]UBN09087.1 NADH dehydrogenase subunit 1 [Haliotis diversicolor]
MLGSVVCGLVSYICALLGVAFFILLERKGLGYFQIRKGPNKVGLMGLPQPLGDAVKLFSKEMVKPTFANQFAYFVAPVMGLVLALLLWQLYPSDSLAEHFSWGILFFLCVSSMNVYSTLLAGWASNSKYALLGAIRAIAQTISYEVSLVLILLFVLFVCPSFSFTAIKESHGVVWLGFLFIPISLVWFVSCIAETNRAPFDFAEGESELVSGFNIEYSAGGFALIFLAEYANILVMSLFSVVLFFGAGSIGALNFDSVMMAKTLLVAFAFVWVRATLPRFRYDLLMGLTWKSFLPLALGALVMVVGVMFVVVLV